MKILDSEYYLHDDVLLLSRDLLGKFLCTKIGPELTVGMIIETEAYRAPDDKASHAYQYKRTKRNEVMYDHGGIAYVYTCYGIHSLFNVVTNKQNIPHAILIRAIQPIYGIDLMLKRRNKTKQDKTLCSGPGTLTQALGITRAHNGISLSSPTIWIEERNVRIEPSEILTGPRIGIDYAGEDALLPWRFRINPRVLLCSKLKA